APVRRAQLRPLPLAGTQPPRLELIELSGATSFARPEVVVVGHSMSPGILPGRFAIVARCDISRAGIAQPPSNARDPLAHTTTHARAFRLRDDRRMRARA